jgi:hypothetical protein
MHVCTTTIHFVWVSNTVTAVSSTPEVVSGQQTLAEQVVEPPLPSLLTAIPTPDAITTPVKAAVTWGNHITNFIINFQRVDLRIAVKWFPKYLTVSYCAVSRTQCMHLCITNLCTDPIQAITALYSLCAIRLKV